MSFKGLDELACTVKLTVLPVTTNDSNNQTLVSWVCIQWRQLIYTTAQWQRTTTHAGVNGSSNGGGGEKRINGSDAGNMSLTAGGPGSGTASRTGGRCGNGTGSHTATGGISGGSCGDNSTTGSLCSSAPDANRFLRLYTIAQHSIVQLCQTPEGIIYKKTCTRYKSLVKFLSFSHASVSNRRPCSDWHVTAPYQLSHYYYYYLLTKTASAVSFHGLNLNCVSSPTTFTLILLSNTHSITFIQQLYCSVGATLHRV